VNVTCAPGSVPLLAGVALAVHERTKLGIVGPNGSGTTTLLRLLAGDLAPDRGRLCASSASGTRVEEREGLRAATG
jgi:ATPase subunit of ABC transporter with duplicated ATPase domains